MEAKINAADVDSASSVIFAVNVQINDFQIEWNRCNLLANYMGEYIAYQFAQRERAENVISTITNEYLESVIALAPSSSALALSCTQKVNELRIAADHQIRIEILVPYLDFLASLQPDRGQARYLELLTSEERPATYFNQLGLAMLNHDFGIQITAHFDEQQKRIQSQLVAPIEALVS